MRILPVKYIPNDLWNDEKLSIPNELKESYRSQLEKLDVLQKAIKGEPGKKSIHGGISDEETVEHFVYRFPASSGRIEFAFLSPCEELEEVSNALMSTFSSGDVSVLDIPGGTGAAMCSLLTTLSTLRFRGVIPVLPLTVRIMVGDFSTMALEIYREMIDKLSDQLAKNGISVELESMIWDATRNDHTAKIVDRWFDMSSSSGEFVVCVSNFTGALIDAKLFDTFSPCLSQILARLDNKKSTFLWIEPESNSTKTLVKKLSSYISKFVKWLKNSDGEGDSLQVNYSMVNPLNNSVHYSSVHILRFERT